MEYQHDESLLLNYKFLASNLTSIPIIQNFINDSNLKDQVFASLSLPLDVLVAFPSLRSVQAN
ncbi:hypothetical protein EI999_03145 [Streptococcus suis]|nr:hypothetical protein EI988_01695 [Streptococcus suis]RRR38632.1 hypothetical protein EI984_03520 [Streptococcus suis]RRR53059.1 hypothetical protein EI999_03145 [Streptococcus suis]